jgi:DNA-directed RNA polymerase delta subunit
MVKINPSKLVSEVVGQLNPRLKEVINKRYGLKDGKRHTLEVIGKQFGITRERVRQIEVEAFRQLKQPEALSKLEPLFALFKSHINAHGKLRREQTLIDHDLESYLGVAATADQKAATNFVLTLAEHFHKIPESKYHYSLWTTEPVTVKSLSKFASALEDYFKGKNSVTNYDEIKRAAGKALEANFNIANSPKAVQAYLGVARNISKNVFGQFGLVNWPEISPRGIKDKAYLVLKENGTPMHFKGVAESITKSGFSNKKAHVQTVHNELIKDDRFVLVGRGTYALKEWGYQPGVVRDILISILKSAGRPMNKDEIVTELLKQRQVKENTILLNLQNKAHFNKAQDGRFTLRA